MKFTEETSSTVKNFNYGRRFFHEFLRMNFFREIARKNILPHLKITTAEEGSSVPSRGRSSSAEIHGRTFFHMSLQQLDLYQIQHYIDVIN